MVGTELEQLAPFLLQLEAAILGFFTLFAFASAWSLRHDPNVLCPRRAPGAIGVVLGIIAFTGFLIYQWGFDQSVLAIEISLSLALALFHPAIALGYFVTLLFLRPWELFTPPDTILNLLPRLMGIMALSSSFFHILKRKELRMVLGTGSVLVLGFAFWVFLTTFKSVDPETARSNYFEIFSKSIILFFLTLNSLRTERSMRVAIGSLTAAGIGISMVAIYRTWVIHSTGEESRLVNFGLLADPNDISAVMILILPFSAYHFLRSSESWITRAVSLVAIAVTLILLYLAKSRGAILSFLVMSAAMAWLRIKSRRLAIAVVVGALISFIPITASFQRSASDLSESSENRMIYWETASRMALHNPILGVGFGNYPNFFDVYAPRFLEYGNRTAHSSWFLVLGEAGPVGLLLFIGLFIYSFKQAWKMRLDRPEFLLSALGYGVAMSFLSHTYLIYPYLLMALIIAAQRLHSPSSPLNPARITTQ